MERLIYPMDLTAFENKVLKQERWLKLSELKLLDAIIKKHTLPTEKHQ